jgi:hypothetical protein
MTDHIRYIWRLGVLSSLLLLLGILLIPRLGLPLDINHYILTLISITGINLVTWFILVKGVNKNSREGAVVLLLGISVKFLLYLLYILVFWLITKIITKPFIISFFTLYLVFTFLLAGNILKLLKNK